MANPIDKILTRPDRLAQNSTAADDGWRAFSCTGLGESSYVDLHSMLDFSARKGTPAWSLKTLT
jgi:hypothetical protein